MARKQLVDIDMNSRKVTNLPTPTNTGDAVPKSYADTKEPAITAGTTAQYWRGDKTWQTLPSIAVGGSTGQIQFNNGSGGFGADSLLFWDNTNKWLGIGITPTVQLDVLGKTRLQGPTYPVLDVVRTLSGGQTTGRFSTMRFGTTTNGDMADGFGTAIEFSLADSGVGTTKVATIGAVRNGADDAADIVFEPGAGGGVYTERMRIKANGDILKGTNLIGTVVRVFHGSTAGTARPVAEHVEWVGSVAPTNGTTADTWIDTA